MQPVGVARPISTLVMPAHNLWNLWPRFAGAVGDAQVADFAPDDRDALVTVPEPGSLVLLAFGLTALTALRRRP